MAKKRNLKRETKSLSIAEKKKTLMAQSAGAGEYTDSAGGG